MVYRLSTQTNYGEYGARYLSYHLHEAGMSDELYHLVVTKEWYQSSLNFAANGQLYREDIRRAFLAAADQIESMAHRDNLSTIGKYLARLAALAWISASLLQAVKRLPLSVLDAMIRLGDIDQAVQLVEAIPAVFDRARFLVSIGQTIFELGGHPEANTLWNRARELLQSSPTDFFNEKFEVLGQLVCTHVKAGQLEEALSLAESLQKEVEDEEGGVVSTTHIALARAWGAVGNIERTLAAARALTSKEEQIIALSGAAGNMLSIDRLRAETILDKALSLFPGIKDRKALNKLALVLAEAGRLSDAWRVTGENADPTQRSRILAAAARGAIQADNPDRARQWLAEAFRTALQVEPAEERLMLLVELARSGYSTVNGDIAGRLLVHIKQLWEKTDNGLDREKRGTIALGLLALGDTPGAKEAVSDSLSWQLPKDDWEENEALNELVRILSDLSDIDGLHWVLFRANQRESSIQQAELAYHIAKAFAAVGDLAHAEEAEELMHTSALSIPNACGILAVWREENTDSPLLQVTARELLDQTLPQLKEKGDLPDDLAQIALTLAKAGKFPLAEWASQQFLEAIKYETDPNTLARVIGLAAEVAVIVKDYDLLHSLKTSAKKIDDQWLQAEALCWLAGWQAVMGRYREARQTYFEVVDHDHDLWQPVKPVEIEAALKAGHMDWVVEIAADIGWPTAKSAAIFAGLGISMERPGPHWIEGALHAIDNIVEGYNSVRSNCHRMIIRKITGEADQLEAAIKYWSTALADSQKRDSGETWAVLSAALPFFYELFGRSFARSLWLELAKAHQLLS